MIVELENAIPVMRRVIAFLTAVPAWDVATHTSSVFTLADR